MRDPNAKTIINDALVDEMKQRQKTEEEPCAVTGGVCDWVPSPVHADAELFCRACVRKRDWTKLPRSRRVIKGIDTSKRPCLGDCACGGICSREVSHENDCFCGDVNHMWKGTDFPVEPIEEKPMQTKMTCSKTGVFCRLEWNDSFDSDGVLVASYSYCLDCGGSYEGFVTFKSPVLCEHANETPVGPCKCFWDCSCREHMCIPADPLYEVDRNKPCLEETPDGACNSYQGHQFDKEGLATLVPGGKAILGTTVVRPSWYETWMQIAHTVGARSYDTRLKVGAIVVSEDNTAMLSLGYNGNYSGGPNTPESDEPGQSGFIHAEANCLIKCPYHYPMGKVMYVTHSPCRACAKMIVNAKIAKVIYDVEYRDLSGVEILRSAGIEVAKLSDLIASV